MKMYFSMLTGRLIFAFVITLTVAQLNASTFTYATPTGAKDPAGNAVSASTIFLISGNTLEITMVNNETNPIDDGQVLDALSFQLTNQAIPTGATISVSGSLSEALTVNTSNGKTTPESTCNGTTNTTGCLTYASNWTMTDTVTGTPTDSTVNFDFCDSNNTAVGCPSSSQQTYAKQDGIVGCPTSACTTTPGQYTHSGFYGDSTSANPYIYHEATVILTLSSGTWDLPANNYTNVLVGFGDSTSDESKFQATPEPSSLALMGAVLALGIIVLEYRRRRLARS